MSLNELINPLVPLDIKVNSINIVDSIVVDNITANTINASSAIETKDLTSTGTSTINDITMAGIVSITSVDPILSITNTSGVGSSVILMKGSTTAHTSTIEASNTGDIVLACNNSDAGANIRLQPNATGSVQIVGLDPHSIPFIDGSNDIDSKTLTNGQLLIGSTGADPVAATITAGQSMDVTNGAGSITIGVSQTKTHYVPVLTFNGGSTGIVCNFSDGYYQVIGSICFFSVYMSLSNKGTSNGDAAISLPLTSSSTSQAIVSIPIGRYENVTTGSQSMFMEVLNSSTVGVLREMTSANTSLPITDVDFANDSLINITGFYYV